MALPTSLQISVMDELKSGTFETAAALVEWAVGFDHGLPCGVKNMARGTQ